MNNSDYYPVTRSLAYLALVVPDLPAGIDEAQEINGLHLVGRSIDTAYLTSGERARESDQGTTGGPATYLCGRGVTGVVRRRKP
jgi:hypothetical protein